MKRLIILLVVLGLLMAFPATAGAGPDCEEKPDHHLCGGGDPPDGELKPGYTCPEYNPEVGAFIVTLTAENPSVCIDWDPDTVIETEWEFSISASDARMLWMAVKDSQPGDFCYQADLWRHTIQSEVRHWVPAAEIDACDGMIGPR